MQCSLLIVLIINSSCENRNFTVKKLISIAERYFRNKTRGLEYPAKLYKKNFDLLFYNSLFKNVYLKGYNKLYNERIYLNLNKTLEVANKRCS